MSLAGLINAEQIFGPLLIGSFANAMLFSLEMAYFIRYWASGRNDHVLLKLLLHVLFLIDLVAVTSGIVSLYSILVRDWGNPFGILAVGWSLSVYVVTTSLGGFLAQMYLISRVWRLTKSYAASGALVGCALVALGGGLSASGITWFTIQSPAMTTRITMWVAAESGTDISISAVLLVVLWRARQWAKRFEQSRLKGPLARLMIRTIETGSVTSPVALAGLAAYLIDPSSSVSEGIVYPLGRIYTLTVYFCLFATGSPIASGSEHAPSCVEGAGDDTTTANRRRRALAATASRDPEATHATISIDLGKKMYAEKVSAPASPLAPIQARTSIGDAGYEHTACPPNRDPLHAV